jgi:hypothetical protein
VEAARAHLLSLSGICADERLLNVLATILEILFLLFGVHGDVARTAPFTFERRELHMRQQPKGNL